MLPLGERRVLPMLLTWIRLRQNKIDTQLAGTTVVGLGRQNRAQGESIQVEPLTRCRHLKLMCSKCIQLSVFCVCNQFVNF